MQIKVNMYNNHAWVVGCQYQYWVRDFENAHGNSHGSQIFSNNCVNNERRQLIYS